MALASVVMASQETTQPATASQTVPATPDPLVSRDNILDTLDTTFGPTIDLVVLEAPSGAGKTTTTLQYLNRHATHAFCLFVRSASRWGYDPDLLRLDLCNQFAAALGRKDFAAPGELPENALGQLIYALQGVARRRNHPFYFLVDGLHDVPAGDEPVVQQLWLMLPLGLPGFRFLITNESDHTLPVSLPSASRVLVLPSFILDESRRYLYDLGITDDTVVEQLHRTCKGLPGRLASVRRLVSSGIPLTRLLEEVRSQLPDLFEIEWQQVPSGDSDLHRLLAIVAFDAAGHAVEDLARITGLQADAVQDALARLPFVEASDGGHAVAFVSEPFRRFATTKLQALKRSVDDLLIKDLLSRPDTEHAMDRLPSYLYRAGRLDQLITYLSPTYFDRTLASSQSLVPIKQKVDLGLRASARLQRDADLVNFASHKSALLQLDSADVWQAEIDARMALDDFPTALALAQSARIREDRLHLLASIAKGKRLKGLTPEPELIDQIRLLYDQIDKDHIGSRAFDLAPELLCSCPDLAMELMDRASAADASDSDYEYARLAIAARRVPLPAEVDSGLSEQIRSRIRSPRLRSFTEELALLVGEYTARQIIAAASKLKDASAKLYYLRNWAMQNRRRADAHEVVDFGLTVAIQATEYTPNARDIRELATPLPFLTDAAITERLLAVLEGQLGSIEKYGPTIDYVCLQLLIARAQLPHAESKRASNYRRLARRRPRRRRLPGSRAGISWRAMRCVMAR
jgi:hypothetical protein